MPPKPNTNVADLFGVFSWSSTGSPRGCGFNWSSRHGLIFCHHGTIAVDSYQQASLLLYLSTQATHKLVLYETVDTLLHGHFKANTVCWRHGVVVSGVRRNKEVNARRAGIPSRYVTSQLGQLSLAPTGVT